MTTDRLGTLLDFLPTASNPSYAFVLELLDPGMGFFATCSAESFYVMPSLPSRIVHRGTLFCLSLPHRQCYAMRLRMPINGREFPPSEEIQRNAMSDRDRGTTIIRLLNTHSTHHLLHCSLPCLGKTDAADEPDTVTVQQDTPDLILI